MGNFSNDDMELREPSEVESEFQKKNKSYEDIQLKNNFKSVWSMYAVDDFSEVPYPQVTELVYANYWGKDIKSKPPAIKIPLRDKSWLGLWAAADEAIKKSGDFHHIYIEAFKPTNDGKTLTLYCGS